MNLHGIGDCVELHSPASHVCTAQERHGDYDLAWYAPSNMVIVWLGHHPVGVFDAASKVWLASFEFCDAAVKFAERRSAQDDDDTITLTERGHAEANLLHAVRSVDGSAD